MKSVIIFSKYPTPGTVKTRLTQDTCLTYEDAATIAEAMLKDTILLVIEAKPDQIIIGYSPAEKEPEFRKLLNSIPEIKISKIELSFVLQEGNDFDARFSSVIKQIRILNAKYGPIVIVGADLPYMAPELINEAFHHLEQSPNSRNLVVGPASGGGIYLVGIPPNFDSAWFVDYQLFRGGIEIEQFIRFSQIKDHQLIILPPFGDIDMEEDLVSLLLYIKLMQMGKMSTAWKFPFYTAKIIDQLELSVQETRDITRRRKIQKGKKT